MIPPRHEVPATAWLGAARGPVAAAFGPGPWEAFGKELARLSHRLLLAASAAALGAAMDAEGIPDEVAVVGQGAGAREAVAWAAANPHRTRRLILIAPEGIVHPAAASPPPSLLARVPLLGRWLARGAPADARLPPQEALHREIARAGTPVIAIWAGADARVPLRAVGELAAWNRQAKHEVIEGAGHDLLADDPARVAETLRDVLREDF